MGGKFRSPPHLSVSLKTGKKIQNKEGENEFSKEKTKKTEYFWVGP